MKFTKIFFSITLILFFLLGCQQTVAPTNTPTVASLTELPETDDPTTATATIQPTAASLTELPEADNSTPTPPVTNWWDDAVFYEVFVRSFADSDGDGVGDLNGLIERLDYLNDGDPTTHDDLGVTGLWLMPIMQSPSYHGYDTVDYYQVDDEYGSNADFQRLMTEAHKRGISIIVDLMLNHTSDQHPWFEAAQAGDKDKRDFYVWSAFEGINRWHRNTDGMYYYAYFGDGLPDLNYRNETVTAEMQNVIRFWLDDMGVDGFRLDAIKHLVEYGTVLENTPETHQWLAEEFYPFYKAINPDALTVGEAWSTTDDIVEYVDDQVDLVFEFSLADAMLESALTGRKVYVERAQPTVVDAFPAGQYATFLANHDQDRARTKLLNDEQAKVAASLQFLSPGMPFIYYGEEIGMQGKKPDEHIRRPMQWTPAGGFSAADPWIAYFEDVAERNVEAQSAENSSILNHYRTLITLRQQHPALRTGTWAMVETDHKSVYAFLRADADETLLILFNLSNKPIDEYTLTLPEGITIPADPTLLLGTGTLSTLPPTSSFVIKLEN